MGTLLPQKRGHSPQFSTHVYCGQTVAHLSYCLALVDKVTDKNKLATFYAHGSVATDVGLVLLEDLDLLNLSFNYICVITGRIFPQKSSRLSSCSLTAMNFISYYTVSTKKRPPKHV